MQMRSDIARGVVTCSAVGCANDPSTSRRPTDEPRGRDDGRRHGQRDRVGDRLAARCRSSPRRLATRRWPRAEAQRRTLGDRWCRTCKVDDLDVEVEYTIKNLDGSRRPGEHRAQRRERVLRLRPVDADRSIRATTRRRRRRRSPATSRSTSPRTARVDGVFREDQLLEAVDRSRPDHARQHQPVRGDADVDKNDAELPAADAADARRRDPATRCRRPRWARRSRARRSPQHRSASTSCSSRPPHGARLRRARARPRAASSTTWATHAPDAELHDVRRPMPLRAGRDRRVVTRSIGSGASR